MYLIIIISFLIADYLILNKLKERYKTKESIKKGEWHDQLFTINFITYILLIVLGIITFAINFYLGLTIAAIHITFCGYIYKYTMYIEKYLEEKELKKDRDEYIGRIQRNIRLLNRFYSYDELKDLQTKYVVLISDAKNITEIIKIYDDFYDECYNLRKEYQKRKREKEFENAKDETVKSSEELYRKIRQTYPIISDGWYDSINCYISYLRTATSYSELNDIRDDISKEAEYLVNIGRILNMQKNRNNTDSSKHNSNHKEKKKKSASDSSIYTYTLDGALDLFGLDKTIVSKEQIKKRYRDLAKKHHPDTGGIKNNFLKLNAAYDVLKDYYNM